VGEGGRGRGTGTEDRKAVDEKERHCLHGRAVLSMVDVSCPTGELRQTRGGKRQASQASQVRWKTSFDFVNSCGGSAHSLVSSS
jgi:hypothetical protein